jgi:hypothetical protein
MFADRCGKLVQGIGVEHGPRLIWIRFDVVDRDDANTDAAADIVRRKQADDRWGEFAIL